MPQFAANLSMLFTERPFMERFEAAAQAGFKAVEYLFPYGFDRHELLAALRANDLRQVLHNLPAGDWDAGERGIACHPERIQEFRDGVQQAITYAHTLGCPRLNCLVGKRPAGVPDPQMRTTLVQNLRFAADALGKEGIELLIEPINPFDIPGFYLNRTDQALALIDEVGSPNLRVQYDIYHAQRTEGEIAQTLTRQLPRIGHIQIADNPGRGEPGSGELNFSWLFQHIDAIGYQGWIGCEYKPRGVTEEGLHWRHTLCAQDADAHRPSHAPVDCHAA